MPDSPEPAAAPRGGAGAAPSRVKRGARPCGGDSGDLGRAPERTHAARLAPLVPSSKTGGLLVRQVAAWAAMGRGTFDDARVPRQQLETMRSEEPSLLYAMALRGAATVMPEAAEASAAAAIATPIRLLQRYRVDRHEPAVLGDVLYICLTWGVKAENPASEVQKRCSLSTPLRLRSPLARLAVTARDRRDRTAPAPTACRAAARPGMCPWHGHPAPQPKRRRHF